MQTLYYYIDESFCEVGGAWHCNVGGAIISSLAVVQAEIELQGVIHALCVEHEQTALTHMEFKCSDFFPGAPADFQLSMWQRLTETVAALNIEFLVSHAWVRTSDMVPVIRPASQQIQMLAATNLAVLLADFTETNLVQMIVDLGLSEGFLPIYQIHAGARSMIPQLKAMGFNDEEITVPHFRNLPAPAFMRSQDSRLLQYSDVVIGLLLAEATGRVSPFKATLLDKLEPIRQRVGVHSIQWNAE